MRTMEIEKTVSILREAAQLIDRISVSGNDKQTAIAVIQALNQVAAELLKKEEPAPRKKPKGE